MVDIVGCAFELDLKTLQHMGITYPIWIMEYCLLQPFPHEQSRLTNIFIFSRGKYHIFFNFFFTFRSVPLTKHFSFYLCIYLLVLGSNFFVHDIFYRFNKFVIYF